MSITGLCYICSQPAMYTCSFCGRTTCSECYVKSLRLCVNCQGKYGEKFQDEEDDSQEILF